MLKAEDYIFESSANLSSEDMLIADNYLVKSHNIEIRWTDSLGEYGKGRCLGTSKKENNEVSFQVYCEYFDSENDKVPQIGWNNIYDLDSKIFSDTNENDFIYMVHSYYVPLSKFTIAKTKYGIEYSSAIKKDNYYGTQFHPEKSGLTGESIIKNFLEL